MLNFRVMLQVSLVECSTIILVWYDGISHIHCAKKKKTTTRLNRSRKNSNYTSSLENKAHLRAVIKNNFHKGIVFLHVPNFELRADENYTLYKAVQCTCF